MSCPEQAGDGKRANWRDFLASSGGLTCQGLEETIFRSAGDTLIISSGPIVLDCNEPAAEALGCTREQLIGSSVVDFMPTHQPNGRESGEYALEILSQLSEAGSLRFEWSHQTLDGVPFETEVSLNCLAPGDPPLVLAIIRDITERREAQDELLREKEFSDTVIDSLPGIFYLYAGEGHLQRWNRNHLEVFGYEENEHAGMHYSKLIAEEDREKTEDAFKRVIEHGQATLEANILTKGGAKIPYLITGRRMKIEGRPYVLGMGIDITPRKRAQQDVERSRRELELRHASLKVINKLASRLHLSLDVETIARHAVDVLKEHTQPPLIAFYILENDQRLRLIETHGFDEEAVRSGKYMNLDTSLSGVAIKANQLICSPDIREDPRVDPVIKKILLDRGVKSGISVPLEFQGKPLGCVNLIYLESMEFAAQDIETFRSAGRTISLAIANALHASQLEYDARHDTLTGLANRKYLYELIDTHTAKYRHGDLSLGLLLLDLDGFKEVNDTLGHQIGDELLLLVANRLNTFTDRHNVELARLGGDEFAFLIRDIKDEWEAVTLAEEIHKAIRRPFPLAEISLEVDASLGIALWPRDASDGGDLLRCADVAMYHSKRHGHNVSVYQQDLDKHSRDRLTLLGELGAALRNDELILHFQPKVNIDREETIGYEALIRWNHPRRGMVRPDEFIPVAELSDLIDPLTVWVVRTAARWLKTIECDENCSISVNVSARNLIDSRLPDKLYHILEEEGLDPKRLELEITESALISDPERIREALHRISDLGIRITVDDFGTGYSSLSFLKQLPLHSLKIDQSFVKDICTNAQDQIIVQSTISLAHNLGLQVVAEGVEDEKTLEMLRQINCDIAQGFHLGRPLAGHR